MKYGQLIDPTSQKKRVVLTLTLLKGILLASSAEHFAIERSQPIKLCIAYLQSLFVIF